VTVHSAENFNRTAKIYVDRGLAKTLDEAIEMLEKMVAQVVLGDDATRHSHHVAALIAVMTGVRAFGTVRVHVPAEVGAITCRVAWHADKSLRAALAAEGAELVELEDLGDAPTITIGAADPRLAESSFQITWDGWTAVVSTDGARLAESDQMPLAPAAAAALGVGQLFALASGRDDVGLENIVLSLWAPGDTTEESDRGPDLAYLPKGVWIVGLGHLGQAYSWCWGLLPFLDRSAITVILQDDEAVSEANVSTGLLVGRDAVGTLKTRLVGRALGGLGFSIRLVERRLIEGQTRQPHEPGLALIGVDNVVARRAITSSEWTMAVDAGLGRTDRSFSEIAVKTFPAAGDSARIPAWSAEPTEAGEALANSVGAYREAELRGADRCGVVQLAGRAAAASFVGVVAACLAIAQPLRALNGGFVDAHLHLNTRRPLPVGRVPGSAEPTRLEFVSAKPHSPGI
jgi:hypothetical protein